MSTLVQRPVWVGVITHRHGNDVIVRGDRAAYELALANWCMDFLDDVEEDVAAAMEQAYAASQYGEVSHLYFSENETEYLDTDEAFLVDFPE